MDVLVVRPEQGVEAGDDGRAVEKVLEVEIAAGNFPVAKAGAASAKRA